MNIRLKECIENREQYILQLCSMRDAVLARKLELIHEQLEMAHEEKNTDAIELLHEWERQVITARIKKDTEKIADAENEMDLEMEQLEVMEQLSDERKKVLSVTVTDGGRKETEERISENEEDVTSEEKPNDEQLSLF